MRYIKKEGVMRVYKRVLVIGGRRVTTLNDQKKITPEFLAKVRLSLEETPSDEGVFIDMRVREMPEEVFD